MMKHLFKKKVFLSIFILFIALMLILRFVFNENYWVNRAINVINKYSDKAYAAWYQQKNPVRFTVKKLEGLTGERPTSLQFGPDGHLYVALQEGSIYRLRIRKDDSGNYQVIDSTKIDLIKTIPNHDDDGKLNTSVTKRQVTGILVRGTPEHPQIYVTSSDPRIGGIVDEKSTAPDGDLNLDTNSGILSLLSWNGNSWEKTDLVRGFPRSEENHSLNGLTIDESGSKLYLTCGANTNAGSPSKSYGFLSEYALSASILEVDLGMLSTMPVHDTGNIKYIYDLPTLDDPARENQQDGSDTYDPFGGHDGLNQAKIIPGSPVQVFSPGYRNPYDIVLTKTHGRKGRIYTIDNGANPDLGGYPDKEGSPDVTNNYVQGEPGSSGKGQHDYQVNNLDNLHLVFKPGMDKPIYGGHPNPGRANPTSAGLFWHDIKAHFSLKPTSDWPAVPVSMTNPIEADFRNPGVNDGALAIFYGSTNGLAEYQATRFFNASLTGDLIAASFNGNIERVKLNEEGTKVIFKETIAKGFGVIPLDLTTQGDFDIFPGTIWVGDYGGNNIFILEPEEKTGWSNVNSADESTPDARHESAFIETAGKFYVLGGRGNRAINMFDPSNGKWVAMASIPGNKELNHFQAISLQNKIYIICAFTGEFPNEKPVPDLYIYDTEINTWAIKKDIIPVSRLRGSAAAAVFDNKIFIVGGSQNGHNNGFVNWTDVYDPLSGLWTTLKDAPHKRDHFQLAVFQKKLYAIGGRRTNLADDKLFTDTEPSVDVYDINTDTWKTLPESANIPTPRGGAATAVLNNNIYIIGGESKQPEAHNETEAFDPLTNKWKKYPGLNTGRHGTQAIVYNNSIYIACGSGKQGGSPELNTIEVFPLK